MKGPRHLLSLADLSVNEINNLVTKAAAFKKQFRSPVPGTWGSNLAAKSLDRKTIALLFNKRSTRTRVASETATKLLGGHPMFLGSADIQLGVNETLHDSSKVISSMVEGIMARVGEHAEVEELAENSRVPVINALSARYHPSQILADLLTLVEQKNVESIFDLKGLNVAWVGDANNIVNDMIVSYPRLGINLKVATPENYPLDDIVLADMENAFVKDNIQGQIPLTHYTKAADAVTGADVVVTDTWISMGQEAEKVQRLKDFEGYQVDSQLLSLAKPDVLFMHCLPRHPEEVSDEVFYGKHSVVFPEAENRKWTIMALFDSFFGQWKV